MKLTVFGATGRTGLPLVEQALAAGYHVMAFVRDPDKMPIQHERLTLVQGDALNAADVDRAVAGADAVLSTLGQTKSSPNNIQTMATRHIVAAMQKHGVQRLVSLTGAGVAAPQDDPKLINHFIKFALKMFAGDVLQDAEGHAQVLRNHPDIEWIMVRAPLLTEGPHTGDYRIGWVGVNTGPRVARADVADFMLKQVTDDTYVHQAPVVSD